MRSILYWLLTVDMVSYGANHRGEVQSDKGSRCLSTVANAPQPHRVLEVVAGFLGDALETETFRLMACFFFLMHSGRAYAACVKILQVKGVVGDSVPGPKLQCTGQGQPGGCHVSDAAICLQSQVRATLAQAKYRSFMQTLILEL